MEDLSGWEGCAYPGEVEVAGEEACLLPFVAGVHDRALYAAVGGAENAPLWAHLPIGPFHTPDALASELCRGRDKKGWRPLVIQDKSSKEIVGLVAYMRIRLEHGSAEIGCVVFGAKLQRSRMATEAMYLLARHLFDDLGYRRYEWNCDDANIASKRAAERFGFRDEGIFRHDMVVKGKSRDTHWYAMTNDDWPDVKTAFETWLHADNFDSQGMQRRSLREISAAC